MKKKITKKAMKAFLKKKLGTDKTWAERAMFRIYQSQTEDEKAIGSTEVLNGIGFSSFDGSLLSSLVKNMEKKRETIPNYKFSNKQFSSIIFVKMPKYWEQILNLSDIEKLEKAYWIDNMQIEMKLEV